MKGHTGHGLSIYGDIISLLLAKQIDNGMIRPVEDSLWRYHLLIRR